MTFGAQSLELQALLTQGFGGGKILGMNQQLQNPLTSCQLIVGGSSWYFPHLISRPKNISQHSTFSC